MLMYICGLLGLYFLLCARNCVVKTLMAYGRENGFPFEAWELRKNPELRNKIEETYEKYKLRELTLRIQSNFEGTITPIRWYKKTVVYAAAGTILSLIPIIDYVFF